MANLLLYWLNNDVKLVRHIHSLDEDFRDGYLLGELLHRHNHQPNFSKFMNKHNADSKINNFCLLEPSMRALGVKFDAKVAHDIMEGRQGSASQLLYELKMKLLRIERFTAPVSATAQERKGIKPLPNLPERPSRPAYDGANQRVFESKIRELMENPNSVMEAKTLRRFDNEKQRQLHTIQKEKEHTLNQFAHTRDNVRQQRIHQLLSNKETLREFEGGQMDQWVKNQERAVEREGVKKRVQDKKWKQRTDARTAMREDGARQVKDDIGAFESRLKEVINTQKKDSRKAAKAKFLAATAATKLMSKSAGHGGSGGQGRQGDGPEGGRLSRTGGTGVPPPTEPTAVEPPSVTAAGQHKVKVTGTGRERRRRKFVREGEEAQIQEYHERNQIMLQEELSRCCLGEAELNEKQQWVMRYKDMMVENRSFRLQQYSQRAEVDQDELYKRDQSYLDAQKVFYHMEIRAHLGRYNASLEARHGASVYDLSFFIDTTLKDLVDLALEAAAFRTFSGSSRGMPVFKEYPEDQFMPPAMWADMRRCFVHNLPLMSFEEPPLVLSPASLTQGEWGATNNLHLVGHESRRRLKLMGGNDPDEQAAEVAKALNEEDVMAYLEMQAQVEVMVPMPEIPQDDQPEDDQTVSKKSLGASSSKKGLKGKDSKKGLKASKQKLDKPAVAIEEEKKDVELEKKLLAEVNAKSPNVLIRTADPRYAVGELIIEARVRANPLPDPPAPPPIALFPLRLIICGKSFAGKSQIALRLAERYNLRIISTDELLNSAVELAKAAQLGHKINPMSGFVTPNRGGDRTKAINDSFEKKMVSVGHKILAHLNQGATTPDDVYAELIIEELQRLAKENEVLSTMGNEAQPWMGWVIDDFPENIEQASKLEWLLSGYDESAHVPHRMDLASDLASPVPIPPRELAKMRPSGIDLVIYIDAAKDAVIRRCLGRRMDPVTNMTYHFEGNLPHYDEIIKERLLAPEDPENPSPQLPFQLCTHDVASPSVKAFFERFGTLREVNSSGLTADGTFAKVNAIVSDLIDRRAEEEKQALEEKKEREAREEEEKARKEEEDRLRAEEEARMQALQDAEDGEVGDMVGQLKISTDSLKPKKGASRPPSSSKQRKSGFTGVGSKASALLSNASLMSQLSEYPPDLSPELAGILAENWNVEEECFKNSLRRIFHSLREQRSHVKTHLHDLRVKFAQLTSRPDNKQSKLMNFLDSFNAIEQSMRFDERTKAELHMRTEQLRHALWEEQDERKMVGETRLHNIRTDGWMERQVCSCEVMHVMMMQAELNRFYTSIKLIVDYHNALTGFGPEGKLELYFDKKAKERASNSVGDGGKDSKKGGKDSKKGGKKGGSSSADDDSETQRLFVPPNAPNFLVDYLEPDAGAGKASKMSQRTTESDLRASSRAKKGGKPQTRNASQADMDVVVETMPRALTQFHNYLQNWSADNLSCPHPQEGQRESKDLSMYQAIWMQTALTKARIQKVATFGSECVSDIKQETLFVYRELEENFETQMTNEMAAIEAVVLMALEACESEKPIEYLWQLEGGKLIEDRRIRIIPPPVPPPATIVEFAFETAFNRPQEGNLRRALERIQGKGRSVSSLDFASVMTRLAVQPSLLPDSWSELDLEDYENMASILDPEDSGELTIEDVIDAIRDHDTTLGKIREAFGLYYEK